MACLSSRESVNKGRRSVNRTAQMGGQAMFQGRSVESGERGCLERHGFTRENWDEPYKWTAAMGAKNAILSCSYPGPAHQKIFRRGEAEPRVREMISDRTMAKFVWSINRRERALFLLSPPTASLVTIGVSKIYCQKLPVQLAGLDAGSRSTIVDRANKKKCLSGRHATGWVEAGLPTGKSPVHRENHSAMTSLDHVSHAQSRAHIPQY